MLRFLRQYSKLFLAVFGSILMVIFLLPSMGNYFGPQPMDRELGTLDGKPVTFREQGEAKFELDILGSLHPLLSEGGAENAALRWYLMVHEAKQMGLNASDLQASEFLATMGIDDQSLKVRARQLGVSTEFVKQAIRHWIIVQQYRELVMGLNHFYGDQPLSSAERLGLLNSAYEAQRGQNFMGAMMSQIALSGQPRVSQPALQRAVYDQQSRVKIKSVLIPASQVMNEVGQPEAEKVQSVFDEYKDDLPGEGEPFAFGYKFPSRVKLEYLGIPASRLRNAVKLEETELYSYYEEHPRQFTTGGGDAGPETVKPYPEVRNLIIVQLRDEKAEELGQDMIKVARSMLADRKLETKGPYKVIPDDYKPMSLRVVAERLQQQFGVLPDVTRVGDEWLTEEKLEQLDGIGRSFLASRPDVLMSRYAMAARELYEEPEDNELAILRLQVMLPSLPLRTAEGSYYMMRLLAAEAAHEPASLDVVRAQVAHNAKQIEAFELLKSQEAKWVQDLLTTNFKTLAESLKREVIDPRPFPRRQFMFGYTQAPYVGELGQNEGFVDAVHDRATELVAKVDDVSEIAKLPAKERTFAVPVPERLSLAVVQIEDYQSMPRSAYERRARMSDTPSWLFTSMVAGADYEDPLSFENLSQRTGFESDEESDADATDDVGE